jgi:hypothetical protein
MIENADRPEAGLAGGRAGWQVTVGLADLAAAAVAATAPGQLDLLCAVTAAWRPGPAQSHRRGMGGSVGCGADPVVVSQVIYPILTGAIAQALGTAVLAGSRRRRPGRHARAAEVKVRLDRRQIELLKPAWESVAMKLGLAEPDAAALADAIHASLLRTLADGQERS